MLAQRGFWHWLNGRWIVAIVVVSLSLVTVTGCAGTGSRNFAWTTGTIVSAGASEETFDYSGTGDTFAGVACDQDDFDFEPTDMVATFTEKRFWIVLGLVVLGWIVLAADFTDD